jgi:hypothetical protein
MILIDLNQLMMTSLHASLGRGMSNGVFDEGLIRHLTLNIIRAQRSRFSKKYGRTVLCCDGKNSWRKKLFVHYKAARKSDRAKQTHIDWALVFPLFEAIKDELREYSNYPIIEVEGAEGDDAIAALAMRYRDEKNIIVSADRDFIQLQAYLDVDQYDPIQGRMLRVDDPRQYLEEHIIEGDRADGVPNVLSDDDTFIDPNKRQGTLTQKRLQEMLTTAVALWPSEKHRENWKRNRKMIDLRAMPPEIAKAIVVQFDEQIKEEKPRRFYEYFVKHKLTNLLDQVSEF